MKLLFDYNLVGFYFFIKHRLELLGIKATVLDQWNSKSDRLVEFLANRTGSIVVTRDKDFLGKGIVLKKTRYCELYTELIRALRRLGWRCENTVSEGHAAQSLQTRIHSKPQGYSTTRQ